MDAAGNVYIADSQNNKARIVTPDGKINTFAGTGRDEFGGDGGAAQQAAIYFPFGVAFDAAGNLYIADANNHRIRRTRLASESGTAASVSAASYIRAGDLASESIAAAFGTNLATTTQSATAIPLPTALADTTVTVRDNLGVARLAPLFYVSPLQINYQIPNGTARASQPCWSAAPAAPR